MVWGRLLGLYRAEHEKTRKERHHPARAQMVLLFGIAHVL